MGSVSGKVSYWQTCMQKRTPHLFFKTSTILTHFKIRHQAQLNVTEIKPQGQLHHGYSNFSHNCLFSHWTIANFLTLQESLGLLSQRAYLVAKEIVYDGDRNIHNSNFWKKNILLLVTLSISMCFPAQRAGDFPQFLRL